MPTLRSLIDPAGRSLALHVTRLQAKLDDMRERLREAAARMLGETVANVVEQVVRELLATPGLNQAPEYRPHDYRDYRNYRRSDVPSWADPESPEDMYDPHDPQAEVDRRANRPPGAARLHAGRRLYRHSGRPRIP